MLIFFHDTATTEIYTLSLHDALPILGRGFLKEEELSMLLYASDVVMLPYKITSGSGVMFDSLAHRLPFVASDLEDRKSTRLNSSHANISYAVFCLKTLKNSLYSHHMQ